MAIGILAPMEIELAPIVAAMSDVKERVIRYSSFFEGTYAGHKIVATTCGVGKVNAAMFTQLLFDHFEIDQVIATGIAGGLLEVQPLDLVVGTSFSHYDVRQNQMRDLFPFQEPFEANPELLAKIRAALPRAKAGKIISGDSFIADQVTRERIMVEFFAQAVDMETSAIAHCCFVNHIPFGAVRCISDLADENADNNYQDNELIAAKKSADAVLQVLASDGE